MAHLIPLKRQQILCAPIHGCSGGKSRKYHCLDRVLIQFCRSWIRGHEPRTGQVRRPEQKGSRKVIGNIGTCDKALCYSPVPRARGATKTRRGSCGPRVVRRNPCHKGVQSGNFVLAHLAFTLRSPTCSPLCQDGCLCGTCFCTYIRCFKPL